MAIDRETSFSVEKEQDLKGTLNSIQSARSQRRDDIKNIQNGGGEEYTRMLREQIEALEKIDNLRQTDDKRLKEARNLLKEQMEFQLKKDQDYEEYLENLKEVFKITQQLSDAQYTAELKTAREITNKEKRKKAIKKLEEEELNRQRIYNDLLKQANQMLETNKEANKSQLQAFSDGLHSVKDEIGKLAVIKGVGDITQGLFDKNSSTNMYNVYRNTSAQLGLSGSEFNQFKLDLNKQLMKSDNFFNFGWKDTADYLNKLGELNITSQEMAEQQYLAVLQGTKYLGLTTDTQAKILKISRDTGRADLLQSTNETMVQIMNAQLGISKDQLNQMVNQAATIADMSVFLGGDGKEALQDLIKIQAAISEEYGKSASDAAMNILTSIMNNPAGNQYLTSGFLGGNYNRIVQYAQNGQMDEALKLIITAIQTSRSTEVARSNLYAANALGADQNIMAIANSSGSMANVEQNMAGINNSTTTIAETIAKFNQDWSDKIINAGSNILSMLPFSQVLTLQNVYYALATVELLTKLPVTMKVISSFLKSIAFNTNKMAPGLDGTNPKGIQALLGTGLSPLVSIAAGVSTMAMFYNDAKNGKSNAEKWGTGETAATIGGLLGGTDENTLSRTFKNAAKYGLAGAAIGSFFPGIGNVAGWVIGTIAGLVIGAGTGAYGGENIAKDIDSVFGKRKDLDSQGAGIAPVVSPPSRSSIRGMGEPIGKDNFPWYLTSPFGYRGVIQTSAGPTNPFHSGIDLAHPEGTPIGANNAGTVSSAGTANDGANYVIVNSGDGYEQIYWHLSKPSHLKRGDHVNEGQLIGYMGMTGHATGPHLHFGYRHAGTSNYINPINLMNTGTFYPTENGYTSSDAVTGKEGEKLLKSVISADTLSDKAASVAYDGIGDGSNIVDAVNNGFAGLNAKLEELSNRQDSQEEVLKQLTSSKNSSVYSY